MNTKEEYDCLLDISKKRAYTSFKHFLELLDIDSELLSNLFEIEIHIDYTNEKITGSAGYSRGTDDTEGQFAIGGKYISDLLNDYNSGKRQFAINDLAISIIHEMLHANRDILIKDGIVHEEIKIKEVEEKINKDLNIELYTNLLDDTISCGTYNIFDNIVPLVVKNYGNNNVSVVAYDKKQDSFVFYDKQKFGYNDINNITMLRIGIELNSQIEHRVSLTIPCKKHNFPDKLYDASDYFHQSHINEKYTYKNEPYLRSSNNEALEETIIEVMSQLILSVRKSDKIDLKKFSNDLLNKNKIAEEVLAGRILERMGINTIRWFILSSHEEEYDDKLYNAFKEKYTDLILCFHKLREDTINKKDYNDDYKEDTIDIIEEKLPKRK